jgi:hypothetical protein
MTYKQKLAQQKQYHKTPRGKYTRHKANAKRRGVAFELTFEQWFKLWAGSGHFDQRHNKSADGYVMARIADRGPYAVGNVIIKPHRANVAERNSAFAYAKRAGMPWDWYLRQPIQPPDDRPDPSIPF